MELPSLRCRVVLLNGRSNKPARPVTQHDSVTGMINTSIRRNYMLAEKTPTLCSQPTSLLCQITHCEPRFSQRGPTGLLDRRGSNPTGVRFGFRSGRLRAAHRPWSALLPIETMTLAMYHHHSASATHALPIIHTHRVYHTCYTMHHHTRLTTQGLRADVWYLPYLWPFDATGRSSQPAGGVRPRCCVAHAWPGQTPAPATRAP